MKRNVVVGLVALVGLNALVAEAETAAELGARYWRTKSEADRFAWVSALEREGHDFKRRYRPDYGPRGIYKFNRAAKLACFVITREISEKLGKDVFDAETAEGPVHFEWTRQPDGAVDYRYTAPTNWDVFVQAYRAKKEKNPKSEANISFSTSFPRRGIASLSIAHHRPDWVAGPYANYPFPTNEIRAIDNFAFAAREALPLLGFDKPETFAEGSVWIGTFDSNFPNGHTDFPPHFHIIPCCRDGKQVHHFYVRREDGRITSDCYQDMSNVTDVWDRAETILPGAEFPCYDGRGRVAFRVKMIADGSGLELSTLDRAKTVRIAGERPCDGVKVELRDGAGWKLVKTVAVTDDPLKGVMETPEGQVRYDPTSGRRQPDTLRYIDPLIGTEGSGSQYGGMMPYTGVPFGSFHMVPMTRLNRVGQLSFNQADDTLLGFILTRQPAIWMGDWGEVRIPIEPRKIEQLESTPYRTKVVAGGRTYEFTATAHAAWLRGSDLRDVRLLDGYNASRDDENLGYPLPNFKGWRAVRRVKGGLQVGVSLVSLEQARANLAAEIGGKSFDDVADETRRAWEGYFARVEIDAPEDVKTIFYTGLFHTLLYPRQMDEPSSSGRSRPGPRVYYSAFDDKVHAGTRYNCYSLWDTYRAEHPWLTLVAPERVGGMMQSLVDMYREGGWLPKWPNPSYTGIMIGAPAEVALAEAYVKGLRDFDLKTAYEAVKKNATVPQANDTAFAWQDRGQFGRTPETRGGLTSYMTRGYVACDETMESVSRTQDFGLNDCAAAVLAEATGHADEAAMFRARAKSYTNLWNAAAREFHPRKRDGSFKTDLRPPFRDYCEQSPHTGVWAVPFDTEGLAKLMGGPAEAVRRLDGFFDTVFWVPERGNTSIHGNEPSHHCAYLYNRWGAPEKTQRRVREILTKSYSTNRKGFDGNEDCGQMSAWYIFSALGFYPLDPASGEYEIGSPLVKGATLRFGAPYRLATLRIVVRNYAPARWRVRRATLNGRELSGWRVRHADLVKGGEFVFEMAD